MGVAELRGEMQMQAWQTWDSRQTSAGSCQPAPAQWLRENPKVHVVVCLQISACGEGVTDIQKGAVKTQRRVTPWYSTCGAAAGWGTSKEESSHIASAAAHAKRLILPPGC